MQDVRICKLPGEEKEIRTDKIIMGLFYPVMINLRNTP